MKTFNENTTLRNFDAWSGATSTKEQIIAAGEADNFDNLIEELYPDGLSETALNDLLWFDSEWLFQQLGIEEESEEESE